MDTFSREKLAEFNGRDGLPILIGYGGKVFDVTKSYHWRGGRHHAMHRAGHDLTDAMKDSPHGSDLLDRFPTVGILVSPPLNDKGPEEGR